MKSLVSAAVAGIVLTTSVIFASDIEQGPPEPDIDLAVVAHAPEDPLLFWAADVGPVSEIFDTLVEWLLRFMPEEEKATFDQEMAGLNKKLGFHLRDDLLAHLGPEIAIVIDLPPIDQAAGLIMSGTGAGFGQALDGIGMWVRIDDEARVMLSLSRLFTVLEAETEVTDGIMRVWWPPSEEPRDEIAGPPPPSLFVASADRLLSVGFTASRAETLLSPLPADERVTAGADFRHVAAHLDPKPEGIAYMNLPRLQKMLGESAMIAGVMAAEEETKPLADLLLDTEFTPNGVGSTTVHVGDGTRRVTYGPKWVTGGIGTVSTIAAIAIPNLLDAINRGRQKRTIAGMRVIGTAVEAYAVDNGTYPMTDGWVVCSELEPLLTPVYVEELPSTDGWNQPLNCLSDGRHYVIASGGRDIEIDGDYSGHVEERQTEDFDDDIVYSDGAFVISPTFAD
jgi:hypothetical protein